MPVWHPWAIQDGRQNPRWLPKQGKFAEFLERKIISLMYYIFMPPPFKECGRALSVAHVRPSVRASVRASFCASVCPSFKWVLCERNSSYNFIPILLKLYMCFCQGLKKCMTFGYNPQINFCHFFHSLNLVIFGLNYY